MPLLEDLYARQRSKQIDIMPFFYSTQFVNSVLVGTTVTNTIAIQADSHFVARYFNCTVYSSPNSVIFSGAPPLTISLFDTGSGRTIQDNAQAIQNLCGGMGQLGNGQLPFILPEPWLIRAAGAVQVTIQNLTLATVTTGGLSFPRVDFSMVGFKVMRPGGGVPSDI